jgi:hypothetical protein
MGVTRITEAKLKLLAVMEMLDGEAAGAMLGITSPTLGLVVKTNIVPTRIRGTAGAAPLNFTLHSVTSP